MNAISTRVEPFAVELATLSAALSTTFHLTGSRAICPSSCRDGADWDYIGAVSNLGHATATLKAMGWTTGTSVPANPMNLDCDFASLKYGDLNILITDKQAFFDKFMLATRTATRLDVTTRVNRVLLFQAILYGNG